MRSGEASPEDASSRPGFLRPFPRGGGLSGRAAAYFFEKLRAAQTIFCQADATGRGTDLGQALNQTVKINKSQSRNLSELPHEIGSSLLTPCRFVQIYRPYSQNVHKFGLDPLTNYERLCIMGAPLILTKLERN